MPKPRKYELIQCKHFAWRLMHRDGVYYADGRSNRLNAGRHSLGTRDRNEALRLVAELDIQRAADLGLIPRPKPQDEDHIQVTLAEGRRLYEQHLALPSVARGVRERTRKRYRTVLDKFVAFAPSIGVGSWNCVDRKVLEQYAAHLVKIGYKTPKGRRKEYRHKTLHTELTTLKQTVGWLIEEGYLRKTDKIHFPLQKAESERPYCWQVEEVAAMIDYCRQAVTTRSRNAALRWLGDVLVGLACTGLRISELASLRWSDLDLQKQQLSLPDETGHGERDGFGRRQTKAGRSRCFPIHQDLMVVLNGMVRKDAYVFHGPRNGRLKADTVRNVLIDKVLTPLMSQFPTAAGAKGFKDGRLHSFRHYFCSRCADSGVPERMVMEWLGHTDSALVRRYYHMSNKEAKRQMQRLDLLGEAGMRSTGNDNRTAIQQQEESPGRESSSAIAT